MYYNKNIKLECVFTNITEVNIFNFYKLVIDVGEYDARGVGRYMNTPSDYVVQRSIEVFIDNCTKSDTARMATEVYPDTVEVKADIAYIDDGSVYHVFDIYTPKAILNSENIYSKIVMNIHGGGFVYGLKEINKCFNMTVAKNTNLPVFSINYQLCPTISVVEILKEIMTAIKYFVDNYGTREIYIMGDSAGGYLTVATWALLVSSVVRSDFKCDICPDIKVNGLVIICPAARDDSKYLEGIENTFFRDDPSRQLPSYGRDLGEVVKRTGAQVPPSVLITSDKDFLHDETLYLTETIRELGGSAELFDGVTTDDGNELGHVYVVGHPEWEESNEPLNLISRLILD